MDLSSTSIDVQKIIDETINSRIATALNIKMDSSSESIDVQKLIDETINSRIATALNNVDIHVIVTEVVNDRINNGKFQKYLSDQINAQVDNMQFRGIAGNYLKQESFRMLEPMLDGVINSAKDRVDSVIDSAVNEKVRSVDFPNASIAYNKIDFEGYTLSSNRVTGLPNLNGIQNLSNSVQLTVMDDVVVIERELQVPTISASVLNVDSINIDNQTLSIQGIKKEIVDGIPKQINYQPQVDDIKQDIKKIHNTKNQIRDLEVSGESLLSDTLYTAEGTKRVGINTQDPTDALTVWDGEVETVIGKYKNQEAYIGTRRRQILNIGANNKVGIRIDDGEVKIEKLKLMDRVISENPHAGYRGDIVLNSNPKIGNPIGWVCLEKTQWAKFGNIS